MERGLTFDDVPAELRAVVESAAKLQEAVPDLTRRYEMVLEACEATDGWATDYLASRPPYTILGALNDVEAGLRQLRRRLPLEVTELALSGGRVLRLPTLDETLRVKAFMIVQRNAVRDYLDVAALAAHQGPGSAAVLVDIDDYYRDRSEEYGSVATVVAERLVRPAPRDTRVIAQLPRYKGLAPRWHDWTAVAEACAELAEAMVREAGSRANAINEPER